MKYTLGSNLYVHQYFTTPKLCPASDSQVKGKNWNLANDLTCLIWPWKMYTCFCKLASFPSICFGPYFRKAVHKKWCCHKLGVVPVFKGLHGNWDTVHLREKVVSWRGDILMPMSRRFVTLKIELGMWPVKWRGRRLAISKLHGCSLYYPTI